MPHEAAMLGRDQRGAIGCVRRLANTDQGARTGAARPLNDIAPIRVERRIGEMNVRIREARQRAGALLPRIGLAGASGFAVACDSARACPLEMCALSAESRGYFRSIQSRIGDAT
jgi:hypothetical protein